MFEFLLQSFNIRYKNFSEWLTELLKIPIDKFAFAFTL